MQKVIWVRSVEESLKSVLCGVDYRLSSFPLDLTAGPGTEALGCHKPSHSNMSALSVWDIQATHGLLTQVAI